VCASTAGRAGWNACTIRGPGDFSGDGRPDILARDAAGSLWLYPGNGTGGVTARTLVGSGWAGRLPWPLPATGTVPLATTASGCLRRRVGSSRLQPFRDDPLPENDAVMH
jgi:hypothetical protein